MSHEYRVYIWNKITGEKNWNSVVLIKRLHSRRFNQQTQVENVVNNLTDKFDFRNELFPDNPSPSIEDTMLMFYRALVIIGPHGAGLSNMLFSHPRTVVIEVYVSLLTFVIYNHLTTWVTIITECHHANVATEESMYMYKN